MLFSPAWCKILGVQKFWVCLLYFCLVQDSPIIVYWSCRLVQLLDSSLLDAEDAVCGVLSRWNMQDLPWRRRCLYIYILKTKISEMQVQSTPEALIVLIHFFYWALTSSQKVLLLFSLVDAAPSAMRSQLDHDHMASLSVVISGSVIEPVKWWLSQNQVCLESSVKGPNHSTVMNFKRDSLWHFTVDVLFWKSSQTLLMRDSEPLHHATDLLPTRIISLKIFFQLIFVSTT